MQQPTREGGGDDRREKEQRRRLGERQVFERPEIKQGDDHHQHAPGPLQHGPLRAKQANAVLWQKQQQHNQKMAGVTRPCGRSNRHPLLAKVLSAGVKTDEDQKREGHQDDCAPILVLLGRHRWG